MVKTIVNKLAYLIVLFGLIFSQTTFALSKVTASVDKNPVMINESIILTVVADDDVSRDALDISALAENFIVGRTSVSSQTSMINFKTSRTTSWQIVLIAKSTGQLVIPALTIDKKQSQPINIEILEQSANPANNQQDIFLTSSLSSHDVYVQQLLTLTLKLHFAVELKSGQLSEPSIPDATIEKIGEDQQSDNLINGKRYRIIEQTYAITPEQSGQFELKAPVFSGEIMMPSRRRSNFLSFAETKPVSIVGESVKLTVRPIPDSFLKHNTNQDNQWLPSELLTLHQEWQASDDRYIAGEPITRTITLTAAGLSKAQLPKITMKADKGLKIYPDQAQLHSNLSKERLVSQKVQNFAIVASRAGTFELPEISVTWFNTLTNKVQHATLPAQTITVLANQDATNSRDIKTIQQSDPKPIQQAIKAPVGDDGFLTSVDKIQHVTQDSDLQWLFVSLWILTSLAWIIHVSYLKRQKHLVNQVNISNENTKVYSNLLTACKKNDAKQALSLIPPWVNQLYTTETRCKITTIVQAQTLVEQQDFSTALNDLQQHLFGKGAVKGATSWQGSSLLKAIQKVKGLSKQKHEKTSHKLNP